MRTQPQNVADLRQELKRKSFHLLGLIYPLALYWVGLTNFRIILIALWAVAALLEIARFSFPHFNGFILDYFGDLLREKERNRPTGFFWMISGALFSAFILDEPMLIAATLFYVVFGDLAASLFGKWVGGPRWFRSEKRLSGTFACFLICFCFGFFLLDGNCSWHVILGSALAATVAEMGVPPLDDNFTIPIATALVFFFR